MIRFLIVMAIAFGIFSCSSTSSSNDQVVDSLAMDSIPEPEPVKVIFKDTMLDNTARFIAGMSQLDSNRITHLEGDKYWMDFKKSMDASWEKMQTQRLKTMDDWQVNILSPYIKDSLKLFYPFSGPDFLHAETFYPHAQ